MRVSTTVLAALPLALANPIPEGRTEPAPLILHDRAEPAPLILQERSEPAPLYLHEPEADLVARGGSGKFIIKWKSDSAAGSLNKTLAGIDDENLAYRYNDIFRGFTANVDRETIEGFRMIPDVEYIEQDVAGASTGFLTQGGAEWGLGRISHRTRGSQDYVYDESAGEGVCVYIVDSGIDDRHPDFEGRAHQIASFVQGSRIDDLGHGTHCAGTIGSKTFGVAKKADLYGIKVISSDDKAWFSDVIAAYDLVRRDSAERDCPNGVVVSSSLGGPFSQSMNDAADGMVDAGFFMAVAAGNDNRDAKDYSPGSAPKVCTVGGTQIDDRRYASSNFGPLIDVNAPAVDILSTYPNQRQAWMSGTSMATPHVAGLAAYLASKSRTKATPGLCKTIADMSTKNAITNQQYGTVNSIAYNGNEFA
ncbi:hypothetical protein LMH87_011961 [Akanthomyces muscarius]|uniref:Uncharacterized protein n=1 Tax=Akanthomyces muscarius TaxID=2231603 RepID=A0A9W8ULB0_AKAMU|nr:hypothetical protein LMH87_011961 [Akanthomyces muscarius]KAJ4151249.1 hypothetical protein LMH87_011961 [Akanthomyces muscarius]